MLFVSEAKSVFLVKKTVGYMDGEGWWGAENNGRCLCASGETGCLCGSHALRSEGPQVCTCSGLCCVWSLLLSGRMLISPAQTSFWVRTSIFSYMFHRHLSESKR